LKELIKMFKKMSRKMILEKKWGHRERVK